MRPLLFTLLLCTLPPLFAASGPALHVPFDGTAEIEVQGATHTGALSGKRIFVPGVNGKACVIQRHAYDQVTTFHATDLPSMDLRRGSVAFWLKPSWNAVDEKSAWLFQMDLAPKTSLYLLKYKNGTFDYSVVAPSQAQITASPKLKAGEWHHFTLTWDLENKTTRLYLDGKPVGKTGKFHGECDAAPARGGKPDFWLGKSGDDRFTAQVADAAYDEVKLFTTVLTPGEIATLMAGNTRTDKLRPVPAATLLRDHTLKCCFTLPDAEASIPQTLLRLKHPEGTITVSSGGAAGTPRLFAEYQGKRQLFESNYPLSWNEPHLLELKNTKSGLAFSLDGSEQTLLPWQFPLDSSAIELHGAARLMAPEAIFQGAREKLTIPKLSTYQSKVWDLKDACREETPWRRRVCLNGMWQTIPTNHYSVLPPDDWGYMRIPGSYRSPLYQMYLEKDGDAVPQDGKWNGRNLVEYRAGWHRRAFVPPPEMEGKQLFLNFEHLNGDYARIYFNGQLVDSFENHNNYYTFIRTPRRINITGLLQKGLNTVAVFIDRRYSRFYEGKPCIGDFADYQVGDVWLEAQPGAVELANVLAFPSVSDKAVQFRVRASQPGGMTGKAVVRVAFKRQGRLEKEFTHAFELNGEKSQVTSFSAPWENPVLWNAYQPELYTLEASLSVDGAPSDSLPPVLWGFREFKARNGAFDLNGLKTRLRMWTAPALQRVLAYYGSPEGLTEYVAAIKSLNFDTVRDNPAVGLETQACRDEYLAECDKQGLYNLFPMISFEEGYDREAYRKDLARFLESVGNHPSIILWYTDFNTCSYAWNQDPAKLNDSAYVPSYQAERRGLAEFAGETMRELDPSREWFSHAGGNLGKIFTSMNYQSLGTPVQEQADWPAQWAARHTQPLMVVESGFPFLPQLSHFTTGDLYMVAEHAARFLGGKAFQNQMAANPNRKYCFIGTPSVEWSPDYIAIKRILMEQVFRAWRGYDVSAIGDFTGGPNFHEQFKAYSASNVVYKIDDDLKKPGLKPDVFDGGSENQRHMNVDYTKPFRPLWTLQREVNKPLLIYLGGAPERFTNRDHAFFAGEKFLKSVVAVNDYPWSSDFQLSWRLVSSENETLSQDSGSCDVPPGEIVKVPISLQAPEVLKKTAAKLKLTITQRGRLIAEDEMNLQFFPRHAPGTYKGLAALFDPVGQTEEMLKKAKFPHKKLTTVQDLGDARLLIIGKDALATGNPEVLTELERNGAIENGLKILVFEQKQCNLANLIFESPSYRDAFIRDPDSAYVQGLSDEDFSDWRGGTDTVPETLLSAERSAHYPRSKWKCGNSGIVSGHVVRKPHWGNFRSIVDSGFNQMFANLMELRKGRGRIALCQLDVTRRYGVDPAATAVTDNILAELDTPFVPVHFNRTAYFGDDRMAEYLSRAGVRFTRPKAAGDLWELYNSQNIILSKVPEDAALRKTLKQIVASCLKRGGNVLALADAPLDVFPYRVERRQETRFKFSLPHDPMFAGIAEADLYFREPAAFPVLDGVEWLKGKGSVLGLLPEGNGSAVFFNLSPLDTDNKMWKKEKIARLLSTLLANMNTEQGGEMKLFTASMFRHNTQKAGLVSVEPRDWKLKLDPKNEGLAEHWDGAALSGAREIKVPGIWEEQGITEKNPYYTYPPNTSKKMMTPYDGYAWYDAVVFIPAEWQDAVLTFNSGAIDDCDWTYFNGHPLGTTNFENHSAPWAASRTYRIANEIVKFGAENRLRIRVFDRWGGGGILGNVFIHADYSNALSSWSPYVPETDFYDVDAFHNW